MSDLQLRCLLQMLEETGEMQFAYVLNNGDPQNMIWWVPACWQPCLMIPSAGKVSTQQSLQSVTESIACWHWALALTAIAMCAAADLT